MLMQKGVSMVVDRMPKVIGPKTHAIIDHLMSATFITVGVLFWKRGSRRAAISSFICGAATAMNATFTNYPGGLWKVVDFETHGKIDAGLAGVTAVLPNFMNFDHDPESRFFHVQGIAETALTALTDFRSGSKDTNESRRPAA
jgi:hypothetical protein